MAGCVYGLLQVQGHASMPFTFSLGLLVLFTLGEGEHCSDAQGRPRFCVPPTALLAWAGGSCGRAANHSSSLNLVLGGPYLLTSVHLRFCSPPAANAVAGARVLATSNGEGAAGGPWWPLARLWTSGGGPTAELTLRAQLGPAQHRPAVRLRVELGSPEALASVAVRGRCQCHGHAGRCAARLQPPRCRCRHHTTGPGCESCLPSHQDWPWRPATPQHPYACQPCSCNLHARRCRFHAEVFRLSGGRSGGVCERCRHHTAGRHCHYCERGYWRDPKQPLSSRRACRACQCHPIGATGAQCNQTNGQCPCKPGVTGPSCDRCAAGYQQSRSVRLPCQRIPEITITEATTPSVYTPDPTCQSLCNASESRVHMSLQEYCHQAYVLRAQVQSAEPSGPTWWRLRIRVLAVYKQRAEPLSTGLQDAWVPRADLVCGCLTLRPGSVYLLLGGPPGGPDPTRLVLDHRGRALPWRPQWAQTLKRRQREERAGSCP
ncbi:netrin-5 [Trichosurus vulpecula]|uniref:netrin-5 n=1 Tax=Trichosurus vulpecula TaxID=9337 RepID=UPI00186B4A27|nr:netrin-5 [Trichosurus vulpecula]